MAGKEIRTHTLLAEIKIKKKLKKKMQEKLWVTDKNVLIKHFNIEALNSDSCLKQVTMLSTKEDKGLLLTEVQILGPDYTDELDDVFTLQKVTKCILCTKNKKEAGCDGTPDEARKIFLSNDE